MVAHFTVAQTFNIQTFKKAESRVLEFTAMMSLANKVRVKSMLVNW